MDTNEIIEIRTAAPSSAVAEAIASALVERRLAACVQVVGPVASSYWWHSVVERAEEWLCLIKTERRLFDDAAAAIAALHPYETPEIIAAEFVAGSESYLRWIRESVRDT